MQNIDPDVHIGKGGWLFLDGGGNDFMTYLRGKKELPQATVDLWRAVLTARVQWFSTAGIKYLHVFAPEKASIYSEYIQDSINPAQGHIAKFARCFPGLFLNVLPYFESIKNEYILYDKTDTHWNRVGAISCYQLICSILKYRSASDLTAGERRPVNALFDLGSKLSPQRREKVDLISRELSAARVFSNVLVRYKEKNNLHNEVGLHVGSRVIFRNHSALYPEKVVIFGDSFAEYRPGRLTEMMAETFEEVHFCWSANIDFDYVRRVQPTIVISELCERFAVTPPTDTIKLDAFARSRLVKYEKERQAAPPIPNWNPEGSQHAVHRAKPKHRSPLPMTGKRGPDYIIVGGMKCGTTILNDYINSHPAVHPAKQKEIHYFSLYYGKGEDWYASFFDQAASDKTTGEASPTYLDLTNGSSLPELIRKTLPNVRIIAIVKDPVDRALSHFFHLRNINKIRYFQSLDPNQMFCGDLFRRYNEEFLLTPELLPMRYVLDFGNYFLKLQAFKSAFRDQLLIINNNDLWTDGQTVMDRVFGHLQLDAYRSPVFERKAYVTSSVLKKIDSVAIDSLVEYYKPDLEMMRRHFGIELR